MKKFMKKLAKKTEGFTLVELIVVIAILGILAAVAVPAYSGYLTKAQDAAVIVELDAIKTAALGANATAGTITDLEVESDGLTVKVTGSPATLATTFSADFDIFYGGSYDADEGEITLDAKIDNWDNSSFKNGATWSTTGDNANEWVAG